MTTQAEIIYTVVAFVISMSGFYFSFKKQISEAENRLTSMEERQKTLFRGLDQCQLRLDKHDEQNRAFLSLIEQMKYMNKEIQEIKELLK